MQCGSFTNSRTEIKDHPLLRWRKLLVERCSDRMAPESAGSNELIDEVFERSVERPTQIPTRPLSFVVRDQVESMPGELFVELDKEFAVGIGIIEFSPVSAQVGARF